MAKPHRTGKQIQSAILKYIKQHHKGDIVAYKIVQANERGVPDLLLCVRGKFFFAEVKGTGDSVKPLQIAQMQRLWTAGAGGAVVKSLDDFKGLVKGWCLI